MRTINKELEEFYKMLNGSKIPFIFMSKDNDIIRVNMKGSGRDLILMMAYSIRYSDEFQDVLTNALEIIEENENK